MHFVKKMPTTEEERQLRDKERAKKQRVYEQARDRVFEKRAKGELDDEMLTVTGALLEKNPDIYTFWNIRRDTVRKLLENFVSEVDGVDRLLMQKTDGENAGDQLVTHKVNLYNNELMLTEAALKANPKSYGAWRHRGWALEQHPQPNFDREMQMCEKALKLDNRNFHCWDHRRVVAKMANRPPEEELELSTRMIAENFSNYSAWHYRSAHLPKVHPDPNGQLPLDEQTIAKELELVANAFFTDPQDQSAWIYAGWLFGMDEQSATVTMKPLSVTVRPDQQVGRIVLVLSQAVDEQTVRALMDVQPADGNWHPVSLHSRAMRSAIWRFDCANSSTGKLSALHIRMDNGETIDAVCGYVDRAALRSIFAIDKREFSPVLSNAINFVLEKCRELMNDVSEKDNMWPLFTATRCLCRLDPEAHHAEIFANLTRLANNLDPQRAAMYRDLISQQLVNKWLREPDPDSNVDRLETIIASEGARNHPCRLMRLGLTSVESLKHLAAYICDLNLAENAITDVKQFVLFPRLTHLLLDDNPIESLDGIENLASLAFLAIPRTRLAKAEQLRPLLKITNHLSRILFAETDLVRDEEQLKLAMEMFKETDVRMIPYYL